MPAFSVTVLLIASCVTGSMACTVLVLSSIHFIAAQLPCADASAAPHRPPTSAWLELLGNPKYHVKRFQEIDPVSAHTSTPDEMYCESTRPDEIVFATAAPKKAP